MQNEKRPLKVFLCHARADKQKVRELYRYLRKRGIQPWLDAEDLVGGQDWRVEIPKAIKTSDAIIICLSKNSINQEGFVQTEIAFALQKALEIPSGRIFIIPARLEECEVPEALQRFQWVDLFEEGGFRKLMRSLRTRANQLELATFEIPESFEPTPNLAVDRETEDVAIERRAHQEDPKPPALSSSNRGEVSESKEAAVQQKGRRKWQPNPVLTITLFGGIFLAGIVILVLVALGLRNGGQLLSFMLGFQTPTPTFTLGPPSPSITPDPCAPGNVEGQVEQVHRHMIEFDDSAWLTSNITQGDLPAFIAQLQQIRRAAESEKIPACLSILKEHQIKHMNHAINTLMAFMVARDPQAMDCQDIVTGTEEETICQNLASAREEHDLYLIELARLLGTPVVTITPSP